MRSQYARIALSVVLSLCSLLFSTSVKAQFRVTGRVFDAETGLPISAVTVVVDSTAFQFNNSFFDVALEKASRQIVVKANGYLPFQASTISGKSKLKIYLIPELVNVQEVTVKAFLSDKRLADTPGSISIIGNRQLRREPTFTLAPSVNKIPGIYMQSGSINTNRLTIRGIGSRSPYGSNKIRAYYGDIPLTNGVGETTLEDLDLEQIANIEILKGPSSGFYGSGLGGVLLFNPEHPRQSLLSQRTSFGSFGTMKLTEQASFSAKNISSSLAYSRFHSDGYRENNQSDRHNLTFTSTFSKNRTTINFLGAFVDMFAYIPSSIDLNTFNTAPRKAATSWASARGYEDYSRIFGGLNLEQSFGNGWQIKVSIFGHQNRNYELRPFNILQEKSHYFGARSTLQKTIHTRNSVLRIVAGNEWFAEKYIWETLQNKNREAGNLLSDNKELRAYNNLFALADYDLAKKIQISASLNLNETHYDYHDRFLTDGDQSGTRKFSPIVSPRLAASWKIKESARLFSVVSHGFSPPTLEETLLPNGARNPSIKPESGWSFEAGTKVNLSQRLYIELSAYYMKIKNLLVARRTADDGYMGINAGATNNPGLEAKIDFDLIKNKEWLIVFRTNTSFSWYRFASFTDNGNDYSGNRLTGTPSTTTNWMLDLNNIRGFYINLHYQTVGRIPIRDDNTVYSPAYQLANFSAGYEHSFRKLRIGLSGGIQNIFNEHYASMLLINATAAPTQQPRYYYPGLPRNYKASIYLNYLF